MLVGDVLDTVRFHLTALPVGRWDLVVSAKDSLFRVKSVGQATVEVRAGETTFVYVYMNPVLETGTIEIVIIWGKPSGRWTIYDLNPVLTQSPDGVDAHHYYVTHPLVLRVQGEYWMYYTSGNNDYGIAGPGLFTCRARSSDGDQWRKDGQISSNVLQIPWAEKGLNGHTILVEPTGELRMWFQARTETNDGSGIGYGTSLDGMQWRMAPDPVIIPTPDRPSVLSPAILRHEGIYYLYYTVQWKHSAALHQEIFLAISEDGHTWTDLGSILQPRQDVPWESAGVSRPCVIVDQAKFKMFYTGSYLSDVGYAAMIGYAESTDGRTWQRPSMQPEISPQDTRPWATTMTAHPAVLRDSGILRMWFAGLSVTSNRWQIGTAQRQ